MAKWNRGLWPSVERGEDRPYRASSFPACSSACRPFSGTRYQERVMSMNKDQVDGRIKEVKGKIKEVAGNLVGNETMEVKGKIQKTLGKAQAKFGDVKKDLQDAKKSR